MAWLGESWPTLGVTRWDLSPSASLCERLNRGAPLSLGTREKTLGTREKTLGTREKTLSESQSSRRLVRVFPSRDSARTEKREGRYLRSRCRSRPCTGDRQLGFWGASTRLPKTSPTWQKKLVKDLDHQSVSEGMIVLFTYCYVFWILYMFHIFIYAASYVGMISSYLLCLIVIW